MPIEILVLGGGIWGFGGGGASATYIFMDTGILLNNGLTENQSVKE